MKSVIHELRAKGLSHNEAMIALRSGRVRCNGRLVKVPTKFTGELILDVPTPGAIVKAIKLDDALEKEATPSVEEFVKESKKTEKKASKKLGKKTGKKASKK